jgi:hypothetical protein
MENQTDSPLRLHRLRSISPVPRNGGACHSPALARVPTAGVGSTGPGIPCISRFDIVYPISARPLGLRYWAKRASALGLGPRGWS